MTEPNSAVHGLVVIDKPAGPTSHDVVARLRKMLGTRAVGHAGTLDPAASGVLIVAVGQATKLVAYLTAQEKRYQATVTFGTATTTLDHEGEIIATAPIPPPLSEELAAWDSRRQAPLIERALAGERLRGEQLPPAFSAIKKDGRPAYERARRGEHVELAPRPVEVKALDIAGASLSAVQLDLLVSKGYYVRSLARDLGEALGVPAHLSSLRRVASGSFTLDEAFPLSTTPERLRQAVQPLARAALRVLPPSQLSDEGARRARHGQLLTDAHFATPPPDGVSAWLDPAGELVAVGKQADVGRFVVERGFA